MSDLTDALAEITSLFNSDFEQGDIILNPGITKTQIAEITNGLPFHLPQEMYELYSWSNGDYFAGYKVFGGLYFLSLEEAVESYCKTIEAAKKQAITSGRDNSDTWWNKFWFPIFNIEEGCYFIRCSQEHKQSSSVFLYDYKDWDDMRPKYKYTNLANMFKTIAECYQTGAYQLRKGEHGQYIEKDYEKEKSIRLKYNPEARSTYYDVILGETFYLPG
ncbi:SMI1/KNR4 family protein [Nostoc sp. FACHB-110]|uniref:SMI1/KNR4 family protein n=1 Tax=Nostoc sp. FACHB-110 TaxID=2692834 RepID=UPI00168538B8|nr:SMI1/KNR4 family protein [Nostoc sp. FACHB-110]MBD2438548.1 SMI1/KNR4 family protein [Nostoc sp. FACHB-110]